MARAALFIFGAIIIPTIARHDFHNIKNRIAHHRAGQFVTGNIFFHHGDAVKRPTVFAEAGGTSLAAFSDNIDTDAGALIDRLDDIGWHQRMIADTPFFDQDRLGDGQTGGDKNLFRQNLSIAKAEARTPEWV